METKENL